MPELAEQPPVISRRDLPHILDFGKVAYSGAGFRGAAVDLRNALTASTESAPWVTAVVVIWGEFEQDVVEGDRVTFVSGTRLTDWLRGQPTRLSETRTQHLAGAVLDLSRTRAGQR